jgi:hypothetical protein
MKRQQGEGKCEPVDSSTLRKRRDGDDCKGSDSKAKMKYEPVDSSITRFRRPDWMNVCLPYATGEDWVLRRMFLDPEASDFYIHNSEGENT